MVVRFPCLGFGFNQCPGPFRDIGQDLGVVAHTAVLTHRRSKAKAMSRELHHLSGPETGKKAEGRREKAGVGGGEPKAGKEKKEETRGRQTTWERTGNLSCSSTSSLKGRRFLKDKRSVVPGFFMYLDFFP